MTPEILLAFVHVAVVKRWDAFAWLCLLMFLGFLRTGEALCLLSCEACERIFTWGGARTPRYQGLVES